MGIISTQAFTFRLIANGEQLDLFNDEDILLSNNVTGLFDIGLQPADFTRQITIPGTKRNNAFFEHYYDISIDNPFLFSTSTKVNAYFEFDSLYLSNGYIQLNKVNLLQNKFIESYEITLYGTISSFGRDINKLYLQDLGSLQQYNHTSSYDNIKASWSGSLFSGDIVYPWCDFGQGWQYTSGDNFFGVDDTYGGLSVQDFKPAIRLKAVWDAIFESTDYTYSSSFWNESWLDDVYMVCNNQLRYPVYNNVDLETFGVGKLCAFSGSGTANVDLPDDTWVTLPWANVLQNPGGFFNNGAYSVTKQSNLTGVFNLNINVSSSNGNVPGQFYIRMINTGSGATVGESTIVNFNNYFTQVAQSRPFGNSINQKFELQTPVPFTPGIAVGTYYFQIKQKKYWSAAAGTITLDPGGTTNSYIEMTRVNQAADGRVIDIPSNLPYGTKGIRLVDFITSIQRKFNLVMYPDRTKPNAFIVESFNNWYNKGNVLDFNKYINVNDKIEVIPANNLAVNNLNFGDTLDTDYVSQQFMKGANREFGKSYYIDTQNFFSQGQLEVETTLASSPLLQIQGTGVSGSVSGLNPIPTHFSIGTYKVSYVSSASLVCGNFTQCAFYQLYTNDGTFASGKIVYTDAYGNNPVTGFSWLVYNIGGGANEIYSLNSSTGEIGYGTGQFC
jgi:hypothetical protein